MALQAAAAEALLIDDHTRSSYTRLATQARNAFKALLPEPEAMRRTRTVAVIRSIAKKIAAASDPPDISDVMDSVSQLLDRSVGAEEYVIDGGGGSLFDQHHRFRCSPYGSATRRTAANHARRHEQRIDQAVRLNRPTRTGRTVPAPHR